MKRRPSIAAAFVAIVVVLALASVLLERKAIITAAAAQAPQFEVDPMGPRPLPNHWVWMSHYPLVCGLPTYRLIPFPGRTPSTNAPLFTTRTPLTRT